MSDIPNNPSTPESSDSTSADTASTEPVAIAPPAVTPAVAPTSPPTGPPAGPPIVTAPVAGEPPARRTWLRNGLIATAALVLAGLIFSAGAAVGWVGGRFDRFDRHDQMGEQFEEVFGESGRQSRRATIEECFFDNNSQKRDKSCPPFTRGNRGWSDDDDREDGDRFDDGEEFLAPVPPIGRPRGGSSSDQPVIVYPDGRVIPLEPNSTAPEPAPVAPVAPETTAPAGQ